MAYIKAALQTFVVKRVLVRISIDFPKAKYCSSCFYIDTQASLDLKHSLRLFYDLQAFTIPRDTQTETSLWFLIHHPPFSYSDLFFLSFFCPFSPSFFICFVKEMSFKYSYRRSNKSQTMIRAPALFILCKDGTGGVRVV